jgi:hypothetical protein
MLAGRFFQEHLVEDDRIPHHLCDIHDYQVSLLAPEPVFFLQVIVVSTSSNCVQRAHHALVFS